MTQLYDSAIAKKLTLSAQNYILNFDINSLYSHTIAPAKMLYVEESVMQFTKQNYQHFLRINNRKRRQRPKDLESAGYSHVRVKWVWGDEVISDYSSWIRENCKPGSVINLYNTYWFANDDDAVLFKLYWL